MENLPQYIWIFFLLVGLLWSAHTHGKKRDDVRNFWHSLIAHILGGALLYWGGFFDKLFN